LHDTTSIGAAEPAASGRIDRDRSGLTAFNRCYDVGGRMRDSEE